MDRDEFEWLRDQPGKRIRGDLVLRRRGGRFSGVAEIEGAGRRLTLQARFVPDRDDLITFNVVAAGIGPICRLDIRGARHRDAGRTHKHALRRKACPGSNLPHADPRPDLAELDLQQGFRCFCRMAGIAHEGRLTLEAEPE